MSYARTPEQRAQDIEDCRKFEGEVAAVLPTHLNQTLSRDELDFHVLGWDDDCEYWLDSKEKLQRFGRRWHLLDGVPEANLFVLDELGYRKTLRHFPNAFYLLRDIPGDRLFLASIAELACVERTRRDRDGKAKFIVDLANFRRLDSLAQLHEVIRADIAAEPWKRLGPLGYSNTPDI